MPRTKHKWHMTASVLSATQWDDMELKEQNTRLTKKMPRSYPPSAEKMTFARAYSRVVCARVHVVYVRIFVVVRAHTRACVRAGACVRVCVCVCVCVCVQRPCGEISHLQHPKKSRVVSVQIVNVSTIRSLDFTLQPNDASVDLNRHTWRVPNQ